MNTAKDFKEIMSAMMSDVIEGTLMPQACNAVCNAGGKLLKVHELERRYLVGDKTPSNFGLLTS